MIELHTLLTKLNIPKVTFREGKSDEAKEKTIQNIEAMDVKIQKVILASRFLYLLVKYISDTKKTNDDRKSLHYYEIKKISRSLNQAKSNIGKINAAIKSNEKYHSRDYSTAVY